MPTLRSEEGKRFGGPTVAAETLQYDNGKSFDNAQIRLVAILPSRPYTPTDNAPMERFFTTLKEQLLVGLPGYKGGDVHSRGKDVEEDSGECRRTGGGALMPRGGASGVPGTRPPRR